MAANEYTMLQDPTWHKKYDEDSSYFSKPTARPIFGVGSVHIQDLEHALKLLFKRRQNL